MPGSHWKSVWSPPVSSCIGRYVAALTHSVRWPEFPVISRASTPPTACLPGGGIRLAGGRNAWPDFIRSQLACGGYTVAGKQALSGVDALRITGNSGHFTLWVNPVTYLPMRLEAGGLVQINFQWLRPTAANLAMLNMSIPASFHQVAPPSHIGPPS